MYTSAGGGPTQVPIRPGMEARRQRDGVPHECSTLEELRSWITKLGGPDAAIAFTRANEVFAYLSIYDRRRAEPMMEEARRKYLASKMRKGLFLRADLIKANYVIPARGRIGYDPKEEGKINDYVKPERVERLKFGKEPGEFESAQKRSPAKKPAPKKPTQPGPRSDFDLDHPKSFGRLVQWAHEQKLSDRDILRVSQVAWPGYDWGNSSPEHIREEVIGFLMDVAERRSPPPEEEPEVQEP